MSRNRYVGDYRIVESMDARGRIRSDSEYIGTPYVYEGDDASVRAARRRMTACCAGGWAGFVAALLPASRAMHTWYISLPFAFAALPLALITGVTAQLYRAKPPFERRHADLLENRAPARTFFAMLLSGIAFIGEAAGALRGAALMRGDAVFSLGCAALFACGLACHGQWKRLKCRACDALNNKHEEDEKHD